MTEADNEQQIQVFHVGASVKDSRIDKYLHGRCSNFSRMMIQEAIKLGSVTVNGKKVEKSSFSVESGDKIEFVLPELPSKEIIPEDIPLDIIYEDDFIIVINKQANLIVHPARGQRKGTLINALAFHTDELSKGTEDFRPGIVHRLDRNTTGVMVIAKKDVAQWKIAKQFENRTTKKEYIAIVHGCPDLDADVIDAPLGVNPKFREKFAVRLIAGKEAVTFFEVQEKFKGYALLKVRPKTGRTHQIRVHLSHIKHPIVGDDMYGGKFVYPWQLANTSSAIEEAIVARPALHAFRLEFKHPTTNKMIMFEAPLPDDMNNMLELLRKFRKI